MAITFGSDYATSTVSTANTRTDALTLGSTGADSILFVVIQAANNDYTTPITIEYNSVAMTSVGGKQAYTGAGTNTYCEFFYLNANLTSGQNLFIDSNATTGLGQNGARSWVYRYFTYGGVSGLGTTKIDTSDLVTSATGSPVTDSISFTPTASTSTIVQMMPIFSISNTTTDYTTSTGTIRETINPIAVGAAGGLSFPFSDYAPGSTSPYNIVQGFNAQFTTATGYGWGVELLDAGGGGITSKNSQFIWF